MATAVEFTDRYGGRAPSWLRGCHDDCEAMGWVPIAIYDYLPTAEAWEARLSDPQFTVQEREAWESIHLQAGEHKCDGWHFIKCPSCHGSGRVSWLRTIVRSPRWLLKGARFYHFAMQPEVSPPSWSWFRRFRCYFYAAFGADIKSLLR